MRILKLMVLLAMLLVAGCTQKTDEPAAEKSAVQATREILHVFSFDGPLGSRYMMHFMESSTQATLFTHDETLQLESQPAASGAKYAGERIMVWIKGDEVLMEVDGKRVGPCKVSGLQSILSQAWLSGTDFWAVGNEPSWNLIMGTQRVVLLTEMGQKSMEFPGLNHEDLDPRNPFGTYSLANTEDHRLDIEIIKGRCTDIMSGEPFAVSVRLVWNGQEMLGCGTGLF